MLVLLCVLSNNKLSRGGLNSIGLQNHGTAVEKKFIRSFAVSNSATLRGGWRCWQYTRLHSHTLQAQPTEAFSLSLTT